VQIAQSEGQLDAFHPDRPDDADGSGRALDAGNSASTTRRIIARTPTHVAPRRLRRANETDCATDAE
jgi:hypothetical protein